MNAPEPATMIDAHTLVERARQRAWVPADLSESDWSLALDPAVADALDAAARHWIAAHGTDRDAWSPERAINALDSATRPLAQAWMARLVGDGPGVLRITGLPPAPNELHSAARLFLIGCAMGEPVPQVLDGVYVVDVADQGRPWSEPDVRAFATPVALPFHVDGGHVSGLACVRHAPEGGQLFVTSSEHVIAETVARWPETAAWLQRPLPHDRHDEQQPGQEAVFWERVLEPVPGGLHVFFVDWYIRRAARHPGVDVPEALLQTLDRVLAVANEPASMLPIARAPGDLVWVDNRRTLHARTEYRDDPRPGHHRLMHRMWLNEPSG